MCKYGLSEYRLKECTIIFISCYNNDNNNNNNNNNYNCDDNYIKYNDNGQEKWNSLT